MTFMINKMQQEFEKPGFSLKNPPLSRFRLFIGTEGKAGFSTDERFFGEEMFSCDKVGLKPS